jgi:hypothetical protein
MLKFARKQSDENGNAGSALSLETEERIRQLLSFGYTLTPWSLDAAESFGLFTAHPQPTDADIERLAAEVRRDKRRRLH